MAPPPPRPPPTSPTPGAHLQVASALCSIVISCAMESIARKNTFTMAVPGGSVLKALAGLVDQPMGPAMRMDWRKVHIAYVNHRVVAEGDPKSSHAKAKDLFMDALPMFPNVATVDGTLPPGEEAERYAEMLQTMAANAKMPKDPITKLPQFDLLLGMGADGHVGSLYPGEGAALEGEKMVVAQEKADGSASITFTHALMSSTQRAVICCTGGKKAAAVANALENLDLKPGEAPAALVKPRDLGAELTWLLDAPAASDLSLYKGMRNTADF